MRSAAAVMSVPGAVAAARASSVVELWHQRPLLRRVVRVVVWVVMRRFVVVRVVRRRGRGRRWPAVVPVAFAVVVEMIMAEAEYHFHRW